MKIRSRGHVLFGACSLTLLGACAQQVGDIDRTQPNKIEKTAFEGEWYFLQTVVDANATANSSFTGLQGSLERVRFDIREDFLVARRTYEDIVGSDTSSYGIAEGVDYEGGAPVAAWPIMMHFDVQRQYNPATGEVQNVIVENMWDRVWYDREWMRPNFGMNVIDSGVNPMMQVQWMANASYIPNDQGPFTSWSIERDEDGEVVYIDVVNEYIIQPDWIDCVLTVGLPNWGSECGPETIKVRSSFQKITEEVESDHIARVYDDFEMNEFGFFRTHRCVMDRRYGCRDNTRITMANIWSIWERDTDGQGNELPYAQRVPDPISYYVNLEMPIDLLDESFEIAEEWSAAFARTVAAAQGRSVTDVGRMFYMCLNPGTTDPTVPAEILANAIDDRERLLLTQAFAASAEGYENGQCQNAGVVKNIGDVRYSYMSWVNNHPSAPWLGYGPSAADPLSAELRHGAANVNGSAVDTYAQYALDLARVINGDLTPEDLGYGENINSYFDGLRARVNEELYFGYGEGTPAVRGDVATAEQGLVYSGLPALNVPIRQVSVREVSSMMEQHDRRRALTRDIIQRPRFQQVAETMRTAPETFALRNEYQRDPFAAIRGTSIESRMVTEEMRVGFGQIFENGPAQIRGDELLDFTSPARWNRAGGLAQRVQDRYRQNLVRTIEMAADFDPYMLGFATEIAELQRGFEAEGLAEFDVQERLWRVVRGRIYRAVQEHEVGHTVGLRHNFEASRDAMNYHPQYWALRSRTFNPDCDGAQGYETFSATGLVDGRVAPESCEDESPEAYTQRSAQLLTEIRNGVYDENTRYNGLAQYQYSSIMDYDGKPSTHFSGLGLYDYAAIAYGYGELVEVFNDRPFRLQVNASWSPPGATGATGDALLGTSIARSSSTVSDMRDVDTYDYQRNGTVYGDNNEFDPINRGQVVTDNRWTDYHYSVLPIMFHDGSATLDLSQTSLQYYPLIDFTHVGPMAPMYDRSLVPRDQLNPSVDVRVPYRFCSDEYESATHVCRVFDLGADDMEVIDNIKLTYDSYYVTDFFRRNRSGFGLWLWPVYSRVLGRQFLPAIQLYQYMVLDLFRGQNWYTADFAGADRLDAGFEAINFVASTLTAPTVGTYVRDPQTELWTHVSDFEDVRFEAADPEFGGLNPEAYIDLGVGDGGRYGAGRFSRNDDFELNYYGWAQMETVSHFITKLAALDALTGGSVEVLGADTISDNSAFWLPPYVLFPDEMHRFFGSLIIEDYRNIGTCVLETEAGVEFERIELLRGGAEDINPACDERGGQTLNPYRAGFGNRDFNIQIQASIYAGAFFQATLDKAWLDNSAVYMYGRGETPELLLEENQDPNYEYLYYTAGTGQTYAAIRPVSYIPGNMSPPNTFVGAAIVERMLDLQSQANTACAFQFAPAPGELGSEDPNLGADLGLNCNMTVEEGVDFVCGYYRTDLGEEVDCVSSSGASYCQYGCEGWTLEDANAHVELNGPIGEFFEIQNELDNLVQSTRFQMEVNMVYNGL